MDGHTVVVDAINSSFFLLDYRFHIDLAAGEEAGPLLASMMAWQNEGYFDAFTEGGKPYGQPYSYMQWPVEHEDGSRSIHFAVEVYPEAALPESLTFVPYTRQGFGYEKEYHEDAAFTIPLE